MTKAKTFDRGKFMKEFWAKNRERMVAAIQEGQADPELRKKISKRAKAMWAERGDELKAKISKAMKNRTPKRKAEVSEAMRAGWAKRRDRLAGEVAAKPVKAAKPAAKKAAKPAKVAAKKPAAKKAAAKKPTKKAA